jgi:hypothetical protein
MNSEYEKHLEAEMDRELKDLPELTAPPGLALRVMRAIEARAARAPYRAPWQQWPAGLRVAAFAALALMFSALCFAVWQLPRTEQAGLARQQVSQWLAPAGSFWSALSAVAHALTLVVARLGTGVWVAWALLVGVAYLVCVGLGTAYFRLALARR